MKQTPKVTHIVFDKSVVAKEWAKAKTHSLTTFYLPELNFDTEQVPKLEWDYLADFPFSNFTIHQKYSFIDVSKNTWAKGINELVCSAQGNDAFILIDKSSHSFQIKEENPKSVSVSAQYNPVYEPLHNDDDYIRHYIPYFRLHRTLYDRKHRFLEQPVSRQVRRANNFPPEYREYIIVPKEDTRYKDAIRPWEIIKRLRTLHAVRGHLRTSRRTGLKNIWVRPHTRGKGDLFQVKEYLT